MRARATLALVAATAALLAPGAAAASTPDLEILTVQPSVATVAVGVPTRVTWTLNIINNGEATTGRTGSIGPLAGPSAFRLTDLVAQASGQQVTFDDGCDPPTAAEPRCHVDFHGRPTTQIVEVVDTVTATQAGTLSRSFTADVVAPDAEGNAANDRATGTIEAVPGQLPTITGLRARPAATLTPRQRAKALGKLVSGWTATPS